MAGAERSDRTREGIRLSTIWSLGDYERVAELFAPMHDAFIETLGVRDGEAWLDVGTGTGAIAIRAASRGARVAALDISERMVELARANAARARVAVDFAVGDAQSLPYGDASFDTVTSFFGVVFAPRRESVAAELARVTRAGGRIALTAWRPRPDLKALYARFQDEPPATDHTDWGEDGFAERLLGESFDVEVEERTFVEQFESPEAEYELMSTVVPPCVAFLATLDDERREEFRDASLAHARTRVRDDGRVYDERAYLLITGRRR